MRLHVAGNTADGSGGRFRRMPRVRWALLLITLVLAALAGMFSDLTGIITALGLLNVSVVAILLFTRDITWGFLFYLTAVIFFQTGFWFRLPGFPDLYPGRVASTLLYLAFLGQILLSTREAPRFTAVEKWMIVFLIVLFSSVVTSGQEIPHWLLLLRGYVYPFLFYYFARAVVAREKQLTLVAAYLVFLSVYLGIMGVFEKLQWYELLFPRFIADPTMGEGLSRLGYRVRGIFLQPAVLGTVLTMGFFVGWLYLGRLGGVVSWILKLTLLLGTPTTIFFTQTRSVYAGFLVALLIAAAFSRRLRTVSLGILLAGMTVVFLNWDNVNSTDRDVGGLAVVDTVEYRVVIACEAWDIFVDSPFVGCGFMNFPETALLHRKPRDVPFFGHIDLGVGGNAVLHNMLISVFVEQGLLGFLPYLLVFFFIARTSIRAYRKLPSTGFVSRDYVVAVWCAMAAYFVNAMALEFRYFEYPNVLYFFLMGSMIGMYERYVGVRKESEASVAPVAAPLPAHAVTR